MANKDQIEEKPEDLESGEKITTQRKKQNGLAVVLFDPKARMAFMMLGIVIVAGLALIHFFNKPAKNSGPAPSKVAVTPGGRGVEKLVSAVPDERAAELLEAEDKRRLERAAANNETSVAPIIPLAAPAEEAQSVPLACEDEVVNWGNGCSGIAHRTEVKGRSIVNNENPETIGNLTVLCGADGAFTQGPSSCAKKPVEPVARAPRGGAGGGGGGGGGYSGGAGGAEDPMVQQMKAAIAKIDSEVRARQGDTKSLTVTDAATLAQQNPYGTNAGQAYPQQVASTATPKKLANATEILYAVLANEADSDIPGPILATVVGEKFNGAKMLGNFRLAGDTMGLQFNQMVWRGRTYPINSIAINPQTDNKIGFATDVDHHYGIRLGGLFLSTFVAVGANAYAQTLENQNTTIIYDQNGRPSASQKGQQDPVRIGVTRGAAGTATALAGEIAKQAAVPITVRVASGTEMGVLLLSDLIDPGTNLPGGQGGTPLQQVSQQLQQAVPGYPGSGGQAGGPPAPPGYTNQLVPAALTPPGNDATPVTTAGPRDVYAGGR